MDKELQTKIIELLQQLSETIQNDDKNLSVVDQKETPRKTQTKRKKRSCETFLFERPFFELPRRQTYGVSRYIIARCRTCGAFMRGNKMLSVFVKHIKIAHPEKYDLYLNWHKNQAHEFKRPKEVSPVDSSENDDVIIIDDDSVKDEQGSFCDDAASFSSDITLDESTTKMISEILDQKITPILEENRKLKMMAEKLERMQLENRILEQEVQSLQREAHCNSILVRGISCDESLTTPEEVIHNLLRNVMWITNIRVEKVEVLSNSRNSRLRSIMVTFPDKTSAQNVLSQSNKLCHTGIFMEPIITQNGIKRKHKLLKLRAEIKRLNPQAAVRVSATHLRVGGYIFEWNILNYLSLVKKHSTKTAIECLNEATGLNLRRYVEELESESN